MPIRNSKTIIISNGEPVLVKMHNERPRASNYFIVLEELKEENGYFAAGNEDDKVESKCDDSAIEDFLNEFAIKPD